MYNFLKKGASTNVILFEGLPIISGLSILSIEFIISRSFPCPLKYISILTGHLSLRSTCSRIVFLTDLNQDAVFLMDNMNLASGKASISSLFRNLLLRYRCKFNRVIELPVEQHCWQIHGGPVSPSLKVVNPVLLLQLPFKALHPEVHHIVGALKEVCGMVARSIEELAKSHSHAGQASSRHANTNHSQT